MRVSTIYLTCFAIFVCGRSQPSYALGQTQGLLENSNTLSKPIGQVYVQSPTIEEGASHQETDSSQKPQPVKPSTQEPPGKLEPGTGPVQPITKAPPRKLEPRTEPVQPITQEPQEKLEPGTGPVQTITKAPPRKLEPRTEPVQPITKAPPGKLEPGTEPEKRITQAPQLKPGTEAPPLPITKVPTEGPPMKYKNAIGFSKTLKIGKISATVFRPRLDELSVNYTVLVDSSKLGAVRRKRSESSEGKTSTLCVQVIAKIGGGVELHSPCNLKVISENFTEIADSHTFPDLGPEKKVGVECKVKYFGRTFVEEEVTVSEDVEQAFEKVNKPAVKASVTTTYIVIAVVAAIVVFLAVLAAVLVKCKESKLRDPENGNATGRYRDVNDPNTIGMRQQRFPRSDYENRAFVDENAGATLPEVPKGSTKL